MLSVIFVVIQFEIFLRLNTRSLDKSLQMTTLVNVAFSPKDVGKTKHF
jgi:hypothetical protein